MTRDATLIQLPTALSLTPDQQLRVELLAHQTQRLRAALCSWTWARTSGGDPDLTAHLHRVTKVGIASLRPPEGQGTVPMTSRAEVTSCLQRTVDEGGLSLPPATVTALASRLAKEVRPLAERRVHAGQLPQPDPDPRVPLDEDIIAVDPHHVHVAGWPEFLTADLWRLPLRLGEALTDSGAATLHRIAEEAQGLQSRDRDGDPTALAALRKLTLRHGAVWGREGSAGTVSRADPHRSGHATLHLRTVPSGSAEWVVTWSIRIPAGWLPPADRGDVVGVDPGVRAPLTWAAGGCGGQLRPPRLPMETSPGCPPDASSAERLTDAVIRRAQYARLAPELDETLRTLLSYRVVGVEDTRWVSMTDDGLTWPREVMTTTGVTEVLGWLRALAPVTGTRVVRVPPWGGSHRCGRCGGVGTREIGTNFFACRACGHAGDADLNSAQYYRWWVLHEESSHNLSSRRNRG